jgi:3-hydroxyacyl-[acyl-carrier protein] dehydratase / trans-2-decenoyl-[acyl-carrier protein] isomerase
MKAIGVPDGMDYRFMDEVYFDKQTLSDITLKKHPLQAWHINQHEALTFDDCFALPLPYMRGFDDAYLSYHKDGKYNKGFATASYEIGQNDPWFYCHFLGDPVMPGSQGQDIIFQLAGLWATVRCEITGRPRALEGSFNFHGQILPTSKKVFYRVDIKRSLKKMNLIFFEGTVAVDDPENIIYEFEQCKIGFFTKEQLGIHQRAKAYYQPNWDSLKQKFLDFIDQSKSYYDRH